MRQTPDVPRLRQILGAPAASLVLPGAVCLVFVFGEPSLNADGSLDNAPMRSAGLILMASPVIFGILALYHFGASALVRYLARESIPSLLIPDLSSAALFSGLVVRRTDGAWITFFALFVTMFAILAVGSVAWRYLAPSAA